MSFEKVIYLPSGGFEYSPLVSFDRITFDYLQYINDPTNYDNEFESIVAVIKKYCKLPTDPNEIYLQDLYYIWMNILASDILFDSDDVRDYDLRLYSTCINRKCNHTNKVNVLFEELNLKQINIYKNKISTLFDIEYETREGIIKLKCRRRKVKDNLEYGYLRLTEEDNINYSVILYICSQIISLEFNGKVIDKKDYFDFFLYGSIDTITHIYHTLNEYEEDFGMQNIVKFRCAKCKKINSTQIFNNIGISSININLLDNSKNNTNLTLKSLFELARLPMFNFDTVRLLEFKYFKNIYAVVGDMKFNSGIVV